MGVVGSSLSLPQDKFAFLVIKKEYELLNNSLTPHDLSQRLECLFPLAREEFGKSFDQCLEVSCILVKIEEHKNHDPDLSIFKNLVIDALISKENLKPRLKNSDYSKGFSGTAADTRIEKEFETLMRDQIEPEQDDEYLLFPVLRPPNILYPAHEEALKRSGPWCRIMSSQGCYMYCHTLTKSITSFRPEEYLDEIPGTIFQKVEVTNSGIQSCRLADLPRLLESFEETGEKRTPLLLDGTGDQQLLTFYSIKGMLEDVSSLIIPYATTGIKRTDIMERCRRKLIGALKSGTLFVLYLGAVTIEHADFKTKLCKKDVFPVEIFQERGTKLFTPKSNPRYKLLFRNEDMDAQIGLPTARESFQTLVVSTLGPEDFEERLSDCIPLGYMIPVYIHN